MRVRSGARGLANVIRRTGCGRVSTAASRSTASDCVIGAVVAHFVHTEGVTGSNPVSRTTSKVAQDLQQQDLGHRRFVVGVSTEYGRVLRSDYRVGTRLVRVDL